jgi:chromosome segregation ATPase
MSDGMMLLLICMVAGMVFLARFWRSAEGLATRRAEEIEALEVERESLRASLSKETQARKEKMADLASLRNKADKSKRRKSKRVEQPLGTAARIRDHEAQLERVELERGQALSERDALAEEVLRFEVRLKESSAALAEASKPIQPVDAVPQADGDGALEQSLAETAKLREEGSKLREEGSKLREEVEGARQTEARFRKRMTNQEQLYASLLAELAVKKDRLRTQEEQLQRLQALKVAVID